MDNSGRKILYIDCGMGAAGDMLTAALLEIACQMAKPDDGRSAAAGGRDLQQTEGFVQRFQAVGIPGVEMQVLDAEKSGITGTHVKILVHGVEEGAMEAGHDHEHFHSHEHEDHDHEHGQHHGYEYGHHHEYEDYDHKHGHHHMHEEHDHEHGHHHMHEDHDHEHVHHHAHVHRSMQDIEKLVADLNLQDEVKADVLSVYKEIAEAEGKVHGKPAGEVHFHEVGTLDAVADITAFCMLIREIAPDEIVVSPIATGYGSVRCAHGVLPVPAPATALLLQGIPAYAGDIEGELCTPTGAALIRHFASGFGQMPVMKTEAVGYGMGTKEFKKANCLRAFLGTGARSEGTEDRAAGQEGSRTVDLCNRKTVVELSCNVDDMTGEEIGFAMERLFEAGALDVYLTPIYMKKNRPGTLIRVMCTEMMKEDMVKAIFRYTSTIGIRETVMKRYVLHRETEEREIEDGNLRKKTVTGYGVKRAKWEYDDLAEIARREDCSLREAAEIARREDCSLREAAELAGKEDCSLREAADLAGRKADT